MLFLKVFTLSLISIIISKTISDLEPVGRIIGGITAPTNFFPFIAYLKVGSLDEGKWKYMICVGSILSEAYILTAAHCILK